MKQLRYLRSVWRYGEWECGYDATRGWFRLEYFCDYYDGWHRVLRLGRIYFYLFH